MTITAQQVFSIVIGLAAAPLLPGIINRTKAVFAGKHGQPLTQSYFDIVKLLRKGAVYSRTTTWIFRAAPSVILASVLAVMPVLPVLGNPAALSFPGDIVLLAYCLGLMRFFTVAAALDTGSSFEGMGASREVQFSALAEPALIVSAAALIHTTGALSLSGIFGAITPSTWTATGLVLLLVAAALFIIFLSENSRIPVDDPNTHLELTMIHEVMILDYSGPDLAFIFYASSLKLWVFGSLIVNTLLAALNVHGWLASCLLVAGMLGLAVITGIIESIMARLSLLKVPRLLAGALILATLALIFSTRGTP